MLHRSSWPIRQQQWPSAHQMIVVGRSQSGCAAVAAVAVNNRTDHGSDFSPPPTSPVAPVVRLSTSSIVSEPVWAFSHCVCVLLLAELEAQSTSIADLNLPKLNAATLAANSPSISGRPAGQSHAMDQRRMGVTSRPIDCWRSPAADRQASERQFSSLNSSVSLNGAT